MGLIYIGIDPEPSGAYCLMGGTRVEFGTSNPDISIRTFNFIEHLQKFNTQDDYIFFIEKMWVFHKQGVTSGGKLMESYGAWQAIAGMATYGGIPEGKHIYKVAAKTWKRALNKYFNLPDREDGNLGKNKDISYMLTLDLLEEYKTVHKYLMPREGVTKKQITDRCEAFLIALFGKLYMNGEFQDYGINLDE